MHLSKQKTALSFLCLGIINVNQSQTQRQIPECCQHIFLSAWLWLQQQTPPIRAQEKPVFILTDKSRAKKAHNEFTAQGWECTIITDKTVQLKKYFFHIFCCKMFCFLLYLLTFALYLQLCTKTSRQLCCMCKLK